MLPPKNGRLKGATHFLSSDLAIENFVLPAICSETVSWVLCPIWLSRTSKVCHTSIDFTMKLLRIFDQYFQGA